MKRIGYSILIGAGCALLFWGISKLRENERKNEGGLIGVLKKRSSYSETYYSAALKVAIGKPEDNSKLIEQSKQQILYRLRGSYTQLSLEKLDKNVYTLKANKIFDTAVFKNAITASGKIEFSELFSLSEISQSLLFADSQLRNRDANHLDKQKKLEEARKNLDTVTDKLSTVLDHNELEKSAVHPGLAEFIRFSNPYQNVDGSLRHPAELGYVKTKDTSVLNKILSNPEIIRLFPENLRFVYGYLDVDLYSEDSVLKLFARKYLDKAFFPFPTGNQITEATPEFETTGHPIISFAFNSQGAQDWYLMTSRNANRPIAIITNNLVLTAPVVEEAIEGGQSKITGNFSYDESAQLCKMILAGELTVPTMIISASFEYHSAKKLGPTLIILIVFVISIAASYGISFLLKPAPKP